MLAGSARVAAMALQNFMKSRRDTPLRLILSTALSYWRSNGLLIDQLLLHQKWIVYLNQLLDIRVLRKIDE